MSLVANHETAAAYKGLQHLGCIVDIILHIRFMAFVMEKKRENAKRSHNI